MKFQIDHDLHIHSRLSRCSRDREQTPARILRYAEENGMSTVCVTNHFWDADVPEPSDWYWAQDYAHLAQELPLPQSERVRFLFGCETDLNLDMKVGISPARFDAFDFVIIPTTHMHMAGFTVPKEVTPEERAELYVKRLDSVLSMDLPFHKIGIAHLTTHLVYPKNDFTVVLNSIPDAEYKRLFAKAAELGAGIELNAGDWGVEDHTPEQLQATRRVFGIAKDQGCKFYLGSDAHHPEWFLQTPAIFESAVQSLGLCENDKFRPLLNN